jgi:hypothetical protein
MTDPAEPTTPDPETPEARPENTYQVTFEASGEVGQGDGPDPATLTQDEE